MQSRLLTIAVFTISVICSGCSEDLGNQAPAVKPRPVTILKLFERDFSRESHLTGSVSLYREEKIGFEVGGRLLAVLDVGKEVLGPAYDDYGQLVGSGDLIAKIDDTRYRLQVQALQARLHALIKQRDAQRIDVEQVAQANLEAAEARLKDAEARLTLARQTLDRQQRILAGGAGKQQAVDDAQSNYDSMVARMAQSQSAVAAAQAAIALKRAEMESTEAKIDEIGEDLRRAQEDLEDCDLVAPFSGRITRIHVTQGAVIEAGMPVVTLSLMDPIQVQVAVSADADRRIQTGDRAILYPKDPVDPDGEPAQLNAIVYEKGAVADPDTRTFRIDLMARNERRRVEQFAPETKGLPVVTDFLPVVRRYRGEEGELFINTASVYLEGGKTYVLRLPGVSFHAGAQRSAVGKHLPDKVEVILGDHYFSVIKWNFRSLKDSGDLREGDFLVIEPKTEHLDGLAIGRPQWLLRPGDLVPVQFLLHATPKGLYVPVDAITTIDGKYVVFAVEENIARPKNVSVHEIYHELRRIEGDGIVSGVSIIVSGVHYVSDDQPVTIVGEETLPR